jgi:hypothetical protein
VPAKWGGFKYLTDATWTGGTSNYLITDWVTTANVEPPPPAKKAKPPQPETALAWLDRRVEEMRVRL